uniref:Uncharacterized protein n=1 Tax=Cacopsylla melanoneura TaxID=428564 RepID=A0A8D8TDJ3_9HEMI
MVYICVPFVCFVSFKIITSSCFVSILRIICGAFRGTMFKFGFLSILEFNRLFDEFNFCVPIFSAREFGEINLGFVRGVFFFASNYLCNLRTYFYFAISSYEEVVIIIPRVDDVFWVVRGYILIGCNKLLNLFIHILDMEIVVDVIIALWNEEKMNLLASFELFQDGLQTG